MSLLPTATTSAAAAITTTTPTTATRITPSGATRAPTAIVDARPEKEPSTAAVTATASAPTAARGATASLVRPLRRGGGPLLVLREARVVGGLDGGAWECDGGRCSGAGRRCRGGGGVAGVGGWLLGPPLLDVGRGRAAGYGVGGGWRVLGCSSGSLDERSLAAIVPKASACIYIKKL
uniref:Uncharacterized protein n=1 Tax=Pyricularia oryzae (strain P131) TaxID=1143193 RepID=L7IX26_PYRO1